MDDLTAKAKVSPRLRLNFNLHIDYSDPCQKFLNAIEPNSYIRPHRHLIEHGVEFLSVLRGEFALIIFGDDGEIEKITKLKLNSINEPNAVEIDPTLWHTIISIASGGVLLEVKAGPFNPEKAKDFATWAPEEGTQDSLKYLKKITSKLVF